MEDLLEQVNEIQESLGRSYAVPDEIDEADLQAELDALELDVEEEGPSYLTNLNQVPDFVDEPPVEAVEVCFLPVVFQRPLLIVSLACYQGASRGYSNRCMNMK